MNNHYGCELFDERELHTSLKKASKDGASYMTESEIDVIDFDRCKESYARELHLSETPRSVDAVILNQRQSPIFVEFKNGFIDRMVKYEVLQKAYDSILIYMDLVETQVKEMREKAVFILVYNEGKNEGNNDEDLLAKRAVIQQSSSYNSFAKDLARLSNDEYVCFGLKRLKNYLFREVHTYTELEFGEYLERFAGT